MTHTPRLDVMTTHDIDQYDHELDALYAREEGRWPSELHKALARAIYTCQRFRNYELNHARLLDRYRTALLFYADPASYDEEMRPGEHKVYRGNMEPDEYGFDTDGGWKAREALGLNVREVLTANRNTEAAVRELIEETPTGRKRVW